MQIGCRCGPEWNSTLSGYVDTGKQPATAAGLFGVLIRLHAPIISQHNSHRVQCGPAYGFLALGVLHDPRFLACEALVIRMDATRGLQDSAG